MTGIETANGIRPAATFRHGVTAMLILSCFAFAADALALSKVGPGSMPKLTDNEGLLLVAVDTNISLGAVHVRKDGKMLDAGVLSRLPAGRTLRLFTAPAGHYRFSEIAPFSVFRYKLSNNPEYEFDVQPGRITYVGDLVFRPTGFFSADIRIANRGLTALDWLEAEHPAVFQRYPFAYVGHYPDPFPDFYRQLRKAAGDKPTTFAAMAPPPKPVGLPLDPKDLWRDTHVHSVDLSPSGELLALQTRDENKPAWTLELIDLRNGESTPVVRSNNFPLTSVQWSGDRALVVSVGPSGAPQQVRILSIDIDAAGKRSFRQMTVPIKGQVLDVLPNDPLHILFSTTGKHGQLRVHKLDISSEQSLRAFSPTSGTRLNRQVDNDVWWFTDGAGELRIALARKDDDIVLMHRGAEGFSEVLRLKADGGFRPLTLSYDGNTIYGVSDEDRAQIDLVAFDTTTRTISKTLFSKPGIDVVAPLLDSRRNPVGVCYYRNGQLVSEYFDQHDQARSQMLQKAFKGKTVAVIDQSRDASQLILRVDNADQPPQLYHLDVARHEASPIEDMMPALAGRQFAPSSVITATSKDGTQIEGFLTLPPGTARRPLIVMAHGGPVGVSDNLHFNRDVQFLASLGYAVLRVNYRGSAGFGKAFRESGHRNYGKLIEDDIDAVLQRVLAEQPVDATRMCAVGFSYGGYSALVSAVRWPDRFRCVVSVSGVSDRILFFTASDAARSKEGRQQMEKVIGDPLTQQEEMMETSPVYHYRDIRVPVMLAHGEEDERVDYEHTRRMQRLLDIAGRPAVGLVFRNEGHSFSRNEDEQALWSGIAGFLQQHLDHRETDAGGPVPAKQ